MILPDQLLTEADQLQAEAKRSRLGRQFNWLLSTLDLGGLLLAHRAARIQWQLRGSFRDGATTTAQAPANAKP
jgi:hypothetical protein